MCNADASLATRDRHTTIELRVNNHMMVGETREISHLSAWPTRGMDLPVWQQQANRRRNRVAGQLTWIASENGDTRVGNYSSFVCKRSTCRNLLKSHRPVPASTNNCLVVQEQRKFPPWRKCLWLFRLFLHVPAPSGGCLLFHALYPCATER